MRVSVVLHRIFVGTFRSITRLRREVGAFDIFLVIVLTCCLDGIAEEGGALVGSILFDGVPPAKLSELGMISKTGGIRWAAVFIIDQGTVVRSVAQRRPEGEHAIKIERTGIHPLVSTATFGGLVRVTNNDNKPVALYLSGSGEKQALEIVRSGAFCRITMSNERDILRIEDIVGHRNAWLIVSEYDSAAVTDDRGRFELKHVPAGKHAFRLWHPMISFTRVSRKEAVSCEIRDGETTTLDEIRVSVRDIR